MGFKYGFWRHPKTRQELVLAKDKGEREFIRGKRRQNKLPTAWDDNPRVLQRTWKKTRKTQYRVRNVE